MSRSALRETPRVSILCSIRNAADVLAPTLDSILAQTLRDWELLIVDDGCTDGSAELAQQYATRDPRLRVISTKGIGRARALNLALRAARAEWVANIDADDPSHPRRIELLLDASRREPDYAVIGTDHIVLLDADTPCWSDDLPDVPPAVVETTALLRRGNPINHSSVLMRRRDLLEVGGYEEGRKRQIDYDLFVRLAIGGFRIGTLPLPLSSRRLHAKQSFEARDRLRYLASSVSVQMRAIRSLPGSRWHAVLIPIRFGYGLLPRRLRTRINRRRRARRFTTRPASAQPRDPPIGSPGCAGQRSQPPGRIPGN